MTFFGGASTNYTMVSRFMKEIQPDLIIGFYPEENDNSEYDQDGYGQSQYGGQSQGIPYRKQDNQGRYSQGYGQSGSGQGYGQSGRSQNMPYGGYQSGGARKPANNSGYGGGSGYSSNSNSSSKSNSRYGNSPSSGARRNTDPMAPPAKPRAMRLNQAGDPGAANGSGGQFGSSSSSNLDTAPANYETLRVGDKVQHSKFGIGVVEQVIGDGGKELYNVQFDSAGKRLLDPRFAKLSKLD
jgi:DNA helicase-2/ATP-dependent DNA helicase PcrA